MTKSPLPPSALIDTDLDGLGHAILLLTQELWVLKDRTLLLEDILRNHGIDAVDEIETAQPSEALKQKMDAEGQALVARVTGALAGG